MKPTATRTLLTETSATQGSKKRRQGSWHMRELGWSKGATKSVHMQPACGQQVTPEICEQCWGRRLLTGAREPLPRCSASRLHAAACGPSQGACRLGLHVFMCENGPGSSALRTLGNHECSTPVNHTSSPTESPQQHQTEASPYKNQRQQPVLAAAIHNRLHTIA